MSAVIEDVKQLADTMSVSASTSLASSVITGWVCDTRRCACAAEREGGFSDVSRFG